MAITDNERLQELVLVAGDKVSLVNKKWWFALAIVIVGAAPLYFVAKASFVRLSMSAYETPKLLHNSAIKQPLEIISKGILDLGNNNYSAYVKIKNLEYDWGVPEQKYNAEFKTLGGTSITKVNGTTFILPAREKIIVFSRFHADQKPEQFVFTLEESHFIHKPQFDFNYELERVNGQNHSGEYLVSAGIKNTTAFTVKEVNLPVLIYDNNNQVVGANFTYINDILSGETRTFQYTGLQYKIGMRPEISPEVNIFDRNVFEVSPGVSPFDLEPQPSPDHEPNGIF